ncbi:unnamed protein product [Rotaria sp. Silwood2]|nr:unnamed protein product [Rotaria sp. Silwood2]
MTQKQQLEDVQLKFMAELDILLQTLHDVTISDKNLNNNRIIESRINDIIESVNSQASKSQSQKITRTKIKKKKNYGRLVKRLKHRFKLANVILRKSDKSKVFHLGKIEDYRKKSEEYMVKTEAYKCLGINDPLPDLITKTNKYLLDLRLAKWISQKQYEKLCINPCEVELAHLYYLPKAHKPGTPLRPIVSGLKHPTIKISKVLDELLRPLFDKMASKTTVNSGFELMKQLQEWCKINMRQETLFCTIDVADLYTMVPQTEGVLSLKKMLDHLKLKRINGLKIETIIRLSRFVMQNNYFSHDGQYYQQIRGGAMGSPLTLTVANCYMFFYEQQIIKQIHNSGGLYFRYIDDIFIVINWPARHLFKQIDRWSYFDENIKLSENIGITADFLDLHIENRDGKLLTTVYQKPSYEPYYLPFNSIHPLHMKKNIIFTLLLRALRYCSTFQEYLNERERLRVALLLNKYPNKFIDEQFIYILEKLNIEHLLTFNNYAQHRQKIIDSPTKEKVPIDYGKTVFVHFTYCSNMRAFPAKFHDLWNKYFGESPINDIIPTLEDRWKNSKNAISGRGNQAYLLASALSYDDWVRNNHELQVWQAYLKMGTEQKHWVKEVIRRTKQRDDLINIRFVQKKINRLTTDIARACATISELQMQLSTYWMQTTCETENQRLAQKTANTVAKKLSVEKARSTVATGPVGTDKEDELATETTEIVQPAATTTTTKNHAPEPVERIEKYILDYIHFCTQHMKKLAQSRTRLAKVQMDEFKALEDFEQIASPAQLNIHLILKPKIKNWSTKNKNYQILAKRVELDLPQKIIKKVDFSFKTDESIISQDEAQATYNQMRKITKDFCTQAMTLYLQSTARENEVLSNEIKGILDRLPQENDDGFDAEPGYAAFIHYHELPCRERYQQSRTRINRSDYNTFAGRGFLAPTIINEANIRLIEEEHELLKLGPKFIFNDPKIAARRRITELATLKR